VVSNPEFLREGTAVADFLHPDRIVVGTGTDRAADVLRQIYDPLTSGSYFQETHAISGACSAANPARLVMTSAQSAEIIKHASNAFLALKISFINAVANLAETVEADIEEIAAGMGMDSRIGPKFLRAGIGYGGSCFPKDVAAFQWVARQHGVDFRLLEEIQRINEAQKDVFLNKLRSALWTLRGKKLAVLGLAFKGNTDDIRESPALDVIRRLLEGGSVSGGLRSRGDGAGQGHSGSIGEFALWAEYVRSCAGRGRPFDLDRLDRIRGDRSCQSEACASLSHRD
jgi:UDPglucose 6-dehydrogenase